MSLSAIPKWLRDQVSARDGGRCQYCQLSQVGQAAFFHVDHILPKSKGGRTELGNLALQCPNCSLRKSNKVMAEDPVTGQLTVLFNPSEQVWSEHFALNSDGACEGKTPVGRATVVALSMNDDRPRLARMLQIANQLIKPSEK